MLWCLIFMIAGAFIFGAGIAFENAFYINEKEEVEEDENEEEEVSPLVLKQWENLFAYDGNEQEGFDENI